LAGAKGHHSPRSYRYLFTRLGISSGALALVAKIEVAKARQLDLFITFQRRTHFLEEELNNFLAFSFIETQLLKQLLSHLSFGQRTHS